MRAFHLGISLGEGVIKQALSKSYGVVNVMNSDLFLVTNIFATAKSPSSLLIFPVIKKLMKITIYSVRF